MDKKLKLAIFLIIFILLFLTAWLFSRKNKPGISIKKDNNIYNNLSKPTGSLTSQTDYRVTSVKPLDEDKNVPLDTVIEITFSSQVNLKDIEFAINPQFRYRLETNNNILKVIPENNLAAGTKYTYIVKYKSQTLPSSTYSFLTAGDITNISDTFPEGAAEEEAKFQRENHPDVYLTNQTPYETDSFRVTSEFIGEEAGHFLFTVTSKSPNAKTDFLNWLKSLDLTDETIAELDISYK